MNFVQRIEMNGRKVDVLRLDLLHPVYGGNKYFKLKYHALRAEQEGKEGLLTFGGPHSNHILATAGFCREKGLGSAGIIRGEEKVTPTLEQAAEMGMNIQFVSREEYDLKEKLILSGTLKQKFSDHLIVPEGGNSEEGVKGCVEIWDRIAERYDQLFCACGTGATFAGLCLGAPGGTVVTGISVLKGENRLADEVNLRLEASGSPKKIGKNNSMHDHSILDQYHQGGYAAFSRELFLFKRDLERKNDITLDHVYTSKLFFAVHDLLGKGMVAPGKKILLIHSGGLQGNAAFEERYREKIRESLRD